jgi:hypothetical protein
MILPTNHARRCLLSYLHQSLTTKFGTFSKSFRLRETKTALRERAIEAIFKSIVPMQIFHFGNVCGVNLSAEVNDLQNSNWFAEILAAKFNIL